MDAFVERVVVTGSDRDEYRVTKQYQGFRQTELFRNGKRIWQGAWKPPRRMPEWCSLCGRPAIIEGPVFSGCAIPTHEALGRRPA